MTTRLPSHPSAKLSFSFETTSIADERGSAGLCCSRRTCSKLCAHRARAVDVQHRRRSTAESRRVDRRKCGQQTRPSTSFVDNTIDWPLRDFSKSRIRNRIPEESARFLQIPECPYNAVYTLGGGKASGRNQVNPLSRFDKMLERHGYGHTEHGHS